MSKTLSGQGALNDGSNNIAIGGDLHINNKFACNVNEEIHERDESRQSLLKSLRFEGMDDRQWNIEKAHAKTCEWFLQIPAYVDWLQDTHGGFLWIKGKPGAGKSTLMKLLLDRTGQLEPHGTVLSFFFNARATENLEKSTLGLYRSLSFQLLESWPQLQTVLDRFRVDHRWRIGSVQGLFEQAVQLLGEVPVLCFIDALDECQEEEVRDMIRHLGDLCDVQPRLRVCVSSRHYPNISVPKGGRSVVLENANDHDHDIAQYINHTLNIGDGGSCERIRTELLEKASGVFMWVVLAVAILNKAFDAGCRHKFWERLRQIPAGLHDLFRDMLARDYNDKAELLACMQWVLFAREPLTLKRLYLAIISMVEPESLTQCHSDEITDDDIKNFVLDKSKGLIEVNKLLRIQFIHESVRDFLLKDNGLSRIWPNALLDLEGRSHEALKQSCLAYIRSEPVARLRIAHPLPPTSSAKAWEINSHIYRAAPFLEYAVSHILFHANEAETKGFSQTQFLDTLPFNNWVTYHNVYQELSDRRFSPTVSPLYTLAVYNLGALIKAQPIGRSCFEPETQAYVTPIFAALACGHIDAAQALLERQLRIIAANTFLHSLPPLRASSYEAVMKYYRECGLGNFCFDFYQRFEVDKAFGVVYHMVEAGDEISLMVYRATERYDSRSLACSRFSLPFAPDIEHTTVAKVLIKQGADINATNDLGWTPLLIALDCGYTDIARLLIEEGADVNAKTHGQSPLYFALSKGYHDLVTLLTQRGARCN
ncbi:hypothetical protein PG993_006267 [Apiospora rasikravindrae]|uniref:Nephrocystin 3-like N-terminal domain-containing protein n=1 Tax=Apiospora rasikravindrae TaxID=990691 RepID=A0ABR1T576_9PEZI